MSLKEEIKHNIHHFRYVHAVSTDKLTDNIIKVFEKRIGEMPPASSTQHFKACKDTGQILAYTAGYEDACEKFMELLK